MNKAEFITELSDRLAILTEEERQDILDEYEQHIDMKVMRGMSEEAAITDFGKIEELIADILEAYHVRADYANAEELESDKDGSASHGENSTHKSIQIHKKIWYGTKHICGRMWGFCKKISNRFFEGVKSCKKIVQTGITNLIIFCRKPFQKRAIENQDIEGIEDIEETEEINLENEPKNKQTKKRLEYNKDWGTCPSAQRGVKMRSKERVSVTRMFAKAVTGIVRSCVVAVCWCLQWFWNLFWGGTGILFGFGSCLVIFFMGTLAVLLIQGYPLTGIMLGGLGLTLCMVSITIWCFSLIVVKKTQNAGKKADEKTIAEMESDPIKDYPTSEQSSKTHTEEVSEIPKKPQELSPVMQEEKYN